MITRFPPAIAPTALSGAGKVDVEAMAWGDSVGNGPGSTPIPPTLPIVGDGPGSTPIPSMDDGDAASPALELCDGVADASGPVLEDEHAARQVAKSAPKRARFIGINDPFDLTREPESSHRPQGAGQRSV